MSQGQNPTIKTKAENNPKFAWHSLSLDEIAKILNTNLKTGLESSKINYLQKKFGKNIFSYKKPFSKTKIFINQFKSPLVYILLIAGIVTLFLKDINDAIVIFLAIIINSLVGYFQEFKASNALAELKKILKTTAIVKRDGREMRVLQEDIVPGDIIFVREGDKIPADARLFKAFNLKTSEAVLTGEMQSVEKTTEPLHKNLITAEKTNMIFAGTTVESGEGWAVVVATGKNTELGKIARFLAESQEEKTPYQKKLTNFSKIVGMVIVVLCLIIFFEGIFRGRPFVEVFTTAVAVAVAAIPESLPVAMTVILAIGMQRILRRQGLVRRLASAETLGSTTVIATDKTLTLTKGQMQLEKIVAKDKNLALKTALLSNEVIVENPQDDPSLWKIHGQATAQAIAKGAALNGITLPLIEKEYQKVDILPFNSKRKFVASLVQERLTGKFIIAISGAPEVLFQKNSLNSDNKKIEKEVDALASRGLRVIAIFKKTINSPEKWTDNINNLTFVGLMAFKDPLRKEVKQAFRLCQKAGLRPIIVTGDHLLTAKAVAKELDIDVSEGRTMTGDELNKISFQQLKEKIKDINVFARVEPFHKMDIIRAWQEKNEVIAMTGDGINDAPALKKADIGVALGSGTDVAKEAADLILLNDSFNIIVAAIEEGRAIIDNIRKVITFLMSDSFTEVILIGTAILFGWPLPILAVQILWVNIIEDGPLGMALAFEPKEKDLMKHKPQGHKIPLMTKEMKILIFLMGIIADILLLLLFVGLLYFSNYSIHHIRSFMYAGLSIGSLFYIFSCKSLRKNINRINIFSNRFLIASWIFSLAMLLGGLYVPFLQNLLKTEPLSLTDWVILLILGSFNMALIEAGKWYFIKKKEAI